MYVREDVSTFTVAASEKATCFDYVTKKTYYWDGATWVPETGGSGASDADAIHDNVANEISAVTEKTTPANDDLLLIEDSASSFVKKKLKISNLPAGGGGGLPLWNINLAQIQRDYSAPALTSANFTVGNTFRPIRPSVKTTGVTFNWGSTTGALTVDIHLRTNASKTDHTAAYSTLIETISGVAVDVSGIVSANFASELTLTENQFYMVDIYETSGTKHLTASGDLTVYKLSYEDGAGPWRLDPVGLQFAASAFGVAAATPSTFALTTLYGIQANISG